MFPVSETYTEEKEQNEEIIRWYTDMLEDAVENEDIHGPDGYLKPCSDDGVPVGFCGWTIIEHYQVVVGLHVKKTKAKPESQLQEKKKEKENWLPSCLDP